MTMHLKKKLSIASYCKKIHLIDDEIFVFPQAKIPFSISLCDQIRVYAENGRRNSFYQVNPTYKIN